MILKEYEAPCGRLMLGIHGSSMVLCDWIIGDRIEKSLRRIEKFLREEEPFRNDESMMVRAARELDEYFAANRIEFSIPFKTYGTDFQRRVWKSLQKVVYGHTSSYKEIADSVGVTRGVRSVASAIAANPISIFVPCHRIVGKDGSLAGYAGGLEAKGFLLELERQTVQNSSQLFDFH